MKFNISFFISLLLLFSCKDKDKSEITATKVDSIKLNSAPKITEPVIDTIFQQGNVIVFGDTTIQKDKIKEVLIQFEPYISFDDFKVTLENLKAPLDLNSHELGKQFRTRIKESYNNPDNHFAGHYTFVTWGCGSPCQMHVLIDRRTGKIYDAPTSAVGTEFKKDSRMLLVNPPEEGNFYYNDCAFCKPEIYILNEHTKQFEKREANTFSNPK
ncbi:hypothetical protein [Flavobacterium sp. NRK F7]|uniref:hypothetical protein n=1 Tax=Flavobacterium sp. NRK F7 TaxID=2954930 RepID=UPI0020912295|nr:hypothetical protein [Flavobacterium sp. NRK F7]MCO6163005.1 hypothetical protein [Flavobacterium sp. NRK F7]